MSVIRTDEWLLDSYEKPIALCEKIKDYFDGASAVEIFDYFTLHGMYRQPASNGHQLVNNLQKNSVWEIVEKDEQRLRKRWRGPEVPIFILPAHTARRKRKTEAIEKSGLAFADKLFLFISDHHTEKEIQALLTHEYHHVCRLATYSKDEQKQNLLDTMIMEGLAENAVRERLGEELVASWTTYYSDEKLEKIWRNILLPHIHIPKHHRKHRNLLYGLNMYPNMAGYCAGYYLVKNYMDETGLTTEKLMGEPPEKIAKIPRF